MSKDRHVTPMEQLGRAERNQIETTRTRDRLDRRIPTGYDGESIPEDFFIPSCTIEDLDKSFFNLFDKELRISVDSNEDVKKVPVIFATGERFAIIKRQEPITDDSGALILPLISIRRTGITQNVSKGMGIGMNTGDIVLTRRISKKDRKYQNLINKQQIKNQKNVSSMENFEDKFTKNQAKEGRVTTKRDKAFRGGFVSLRGEVSDNIIETISIPFPRFYEATYEVTFWAQYTQHMNSMIEQFMISTHPPARNFKIVSDKGYWFVAYVGDDFSDGGNFDDFTDQERIVRYSFTMTANGYLIANQGENRQSPFRYYESAPQISFNITESPKLYNNRGNKPTYNSGESDKFILRDVNNLDNQDEQKVQKGRGYDYELREMVDPATGETKMFKVRTITRDQKNGETIIDLRKLDGDLLL